MQVPGTYSEADEDPVFNEPIFVAGDLLAALATDNFFALILRVYKEHNAWFYDMVRFDLKNGPVLTAIEIYPIHRWWKKVQEAEQVKAEQLKGAQ